MGSSDLESHGSGKKHKEKLEAHCKLGTISMFMNKKVNDAENLKPSTSSNSETLTSSEKISSYVTKNEVINAKILWCLKIVSGHFSFNSCSDLGAIFKCMFPDSNIAKDFSLGKTKCRYTIIHGITPYSKEEFFTIFFTFF